MDTMFEPSRPINLSQSDMQFAPSPKIESTLWSKPFGIPRSEKESLLKTLHQHKGSKNTMAFRQTKDSNPAPPAPCGAVSPKRARHLERNRAAASKCRLKKKREHEQIQSVLDNESTKRDILLAEVDCLKEEIWQLTNTIFEHAKCEDQQINLQLAKMTQKYIESSPSQSPQLSFSASTMFYGSLEAGKSPNMSGDLSVSWPEDDTMALEGNSEEIFDIFVDVTNM
ncbi:uncharacterized protein N7482_007583 [Penicillium canariense]|uniref:BZIP domain-containing protein n=1 Tax=Penicillium canariense TaxID=189055 RepID=A0A9W9LK89_9EURO|nr:uncharacterized protein N7482_007583 [Penicillium canariense]KAJ5160579.1 hypothetical protein N7482_007583 [Penicillium canariense]